MKNLDAATARFILEQKVSFLNTLGNVSMLWWVTSVVFSLSILAGVWKFREQLVEKKWIKVIGMFGFVFFSTIVLYGVAVFLYIYFVSAEIIKYAKSLEISFNYIYAELVLFQTAITLGTITFVGILFLWTKMCFGQNEINSEEEISNNIKSKTIEPGDKLSENLNEQISASLEPIQDNENKDAKSKDTSTSTSASPLEKFKIYTDFYKFYCELPFKVGTAFSVSSTLVLFFITKLVKNDLWVVLATFLLMVVSFVIGLKLFIIEDKHIPIEQTEIDALKKELGLKTGPDIKVLRWILRLSVIGFVLPVLLLGTFVIITYWVS